MYYHGVYGSTPALHELLKYNLAVGVGRNLTASVFQAHTLQWPLTLSCLVCLAINSSALPAAFTAELLGNKTLMTQALLEGGANATDHVSFKPLDESGRLLKSVLLISRHCYAKHHNVVEEVQFITASSSITKLYS